MRTIEDRAGPLACHQCGHAAWEHAFGFQRGACEICSCAVFRAPQVLAEAGGEPRFVAVSAYKLARVVSLLVRAREFLPRDLQAEVRIALWAGFGE